MFIAASNKMEKQNPTKIVANSNLFHRFCGSKKGLMVSPSFNVATVTPCLHRSGQWTPHHLGSAEVSEFLGSSKRIIGRFSSQVWYTQWVSNISQWVLIFDIISGKIIFQPGKWWIVIFPARDIISPSGYVPEFKGYTSLSMKYEWC